jgi:hypothetical protein
MNNKTKRELVPEMIPHTPHPRNQESHIKPNPQDQLTQMFRQLTRYKTQTQLLPIMQKTCMQSGQGRRPQPVSAPLLDYQHKSQLENQHMMRRATQYRILVMRRATMEVVLKLSHATKASPRLLVEIRVTLLTSLNTVRHVPTLPQMMGVSPWKPLPPV